MESKFSKYKSEGKAVSNHIANVNSFIDLMYDKGRDLFVAEIEDLTRRIEAGGAPPIFTSKRSQLIDLGEAIERLYETYHFNKSKDN